MHEHQRPPTFADLLRLRDARRERLLDRRAKHTELLQSASSPAPDRKGKGKGKASESSESIHQNGKHSASHLAYTSQGVDRTYMSIWEELQSSIARESSLRRALLGLDSTPESISKCDDEADDSLAFYASHPSLRPMPDILLRPDLEAYVRELESKRIQQVSSSGQKDSGKSRHTGSWLLSKCRQIIVAAAGVEAATDAAEALCTEVFKVLRCDRTDDDIQGQLLELVGFDNMEFLGQLVSQRANIVRGITDEADRARVAAAMRDRAIPGVQAIIRSEKDVAIEKEINKARRKAKGKGKQTEDGSLEDQEAARILGFGADLRRARERQLSQRPAEVLRPE
ncbi:activating signal cointegrator 1 complex subunit 3, partial [Coemansia sp. RSA 2440]